MAVAVQDTYFGELSAAQEERARRLHTEAFVIDMCSATNPSKPTPERNGQFAMERMIAGGLTAANVTTAAMRDDFRAAVREIVDLRRFVRVRAGQCVLVETAEDVRRAKREGKVGLIVGFQTGSPIEDDWLTNGSALQLLGLRVLQLTYNEANLIGSGCLEPTDNGLTGFGRQVVHGCNAAGIIVDGSHVGQRTVRDAAKYSTQPIIYSHTNSNRLFPNARNADDDTYRAVAATGGVVGTEPGGGARLKKDADHQATIRDMLDNLEYCAELVGIDHVGIGTDINENYKALPMQSAWAATYMPPTYRSGSLPGFGWLDEFPNVTRGLVARGFSDEDVKKILGGNWLRVMEQVWPKRERVQA